MLDEMLIAKNYDDYSPGMATVTVMIVCTVCIGVWMCY